MDLHRKRRKAGHQEFGPPSVVFTPSKTPSHIKTRTERAGDMEVAIFGLAFFVLCIIAVTSALVGLALRQGRTKPRSDRMSVGE